jgi:hypothetical protein
LTERSRFGTFSRALALVVLDVAVLGVAVLGVSVLDSLLTEALVDCVVTAEGVELEPHPARARTTSAPASLKGGRHPR